MFVRLLGELAVLPARISRTRVVPLLVPSLRHSSIPLVLSNAEKKSRPLTFVRLLGELPVLPARISRTSIVPLLVPSLRHSSIPLVLSAAEKKSRH